MSQRGNVRLPVLPPDFEWRLDVPKDMSECPKEPVCPHINCPAHLWRVDGRDMPGRRYEGKLPPSDIKLSSPATCMHAEANKGPRSVKEIAEAMGMTPRRVQQLLKRLLEMPHVAAWVRQIKRGREGR